jgi:hypothetical protein
LHKLSFSIACQGVTLQLSFFEIDNWDVTFP